MSITTNEASRKLQSLGIVRGSKLKLLKYNKNGTCLIAIASTRLAIESALLNFIFVGNC